jgi:simple sugar transport system permease protein
LLLAYAAPVAIAAMGETVNQKGGLLNIGLEGAMLAAAFVAMLASGASGSAWIGLAAGVGVGLVSSALQGAFVLRLAADQVVVGAAFNLLALGLTSTLFRVIYGGQGKLLSVPQVPKLGGIDPIVVLMLLLAPACWWLIERSRWGLALRAAGGYPQALDAAGHSVYRVRFQALLFGGALAGLAGAYLSLGIAGSFAENMTAGRGFVAIAMVTFGRWKPLWVLAACLLVGYAETLQFTFQAKGWDAPFQLFVAMPYALALLVLIAVGRGQGAPAALGIPYRRNG